MDDRRLPISTSAADTQQPLPVVLTLETGSASSSATTLSFTIPVHTPQHAPSWQELLGQR